MPAGMPYAVDLHPQRDKIIRRFMEGDSLRAVGEGIVPPISAMALQRYKSKVIMPILARAQQSESLLIGESGKKQPLVTPNALQKAEKATAQALQDAPVFSIFRQRLEKLNGLIDRTLTKAESSVRIATDKDGNQVVVGADIGVMAPLLNQAHKNLEILGRATGELEPQGGGSVSIQILCPAAGTSVDQMPRITFSDVNAIEGTAESAGDVEESEDIGLIQGQ